MANRLDGLIQINGDSVQTLEIILLLGLLTLLPSAVVMMTCFTRYAISLSFLRNALGTQQVPPNMVLVGLALFLTLFTMSPVINDINETAYQPYLDEQITETEFFDLAQIPLKKFMLRNTVPEPFELFYSMYAPDAAVPTEEADLTALPLRVIVPAFITSELQKAFQIGLYLYIPFVLVDVVVSTTLVSMGMIMLPPAMISTPFKLLLFISVNGWELMFSTLVRSYAPYA